MKRDGVDRRVFIKTLAGSVPAMAVLPGVFASGRPLRMMQSGVQAESQGVLQNNVRIKFAVLGANHPHIYNQIEAVRRGGGEFIAYYVPDSEFAAGILQRYPEVKAARSETEVFEDPSILLIVSAAIPEQRAAIGIRAMQHGKDFMADKPGIVSLGQLEEVRRVQAQTKRIYSIMYSERFENRATVAAGELVKAGAIGRVIQTIGLGPHRLNPQQRQAWFFDRKHFGGILCDIASHQADQFLFFTGSTTAEVVASQAGNISHPQYPEFEDFGDMMLRGNMGTGYVRVDWFTPDGLATWGDGRLTILGTDGYIEIRKNIDIAGRPGPSHLFLVDRKDARYIDCNAHPLPYGEQLVDDVLNRTSSAMSQDHCFLATELVLKAQKNAHKLKFA